MIFSVYYISYHNNISIVNKGIIKAGIWYFRQSWCGVTPGFSF